MEYKPIYLSENKRFQTGTIVFVETTGIQLFHQELPERDREYTNPSIEHTPWDTLQLEIEDPFRNLLRFNQNKEK